MISNSKRIRKRHVPAIVTSSASLGATAIAIVAASAASSVIASMTTNSAVCVVQGSPVTRCSDHLSNEMIAEEKTVLVFVKVL